MTADPGHAFQAASTCLGYPDEHWRAQLPSLGELAHRLGGPGAPLRRFLDHASSSSAHAMTRHYVDTFDAPWRCSPHLTYAAHGAGPRRVMALQAFSQAYRAAGEELTSGEQPDHLAVVCEFAARHPAEGTRLLQAHRSGVELLRVTLEEIGSPYVHVVDLVRGALPPLPSDGAGHR